MFAVTISGRRHGVMALPDSNVLSVARRLVRRAHERLKQRERGNPMSDVQRLLTQLASSVATGSTGTYVFLFVNGMRVSGMLISRKAYLEEMRQIATVLSEEERALFEAAFRGLESGAELLDTLYLHHAHVNDQPFATMCVEVAAISAVAVMVG